MLESADDEEEASWLEGAYIASMEVFARDGWDDPRMDVYDSLDPSKDPSRKDP